MKKISAAEATLGQLGKLPRDNWEYGDFWMCTDASTVSIVHQGWGEPVEQSIRLPRRYFNALIRGYLKKHEI